MKALYKNEKKKKAALKRIKKKLRKKLYVVGEITWSREDLYKR